MRNFLVVILFLSAVFVSAPHAQQNRYTSKSFFHSNKSAIVQVLSSHKVRGTGFLIAADVVITANHVVSSQLSYLPDISVQFPNGTFISASPLKAAPTEETTLHDYAVLRLQSGVKGPFLKLGTWAEVTEGDDLTTVGYPLGSPYPVLLTAIVAGRFAIPRGDIILFQGPANRGLSGAPLVSNRTGNVLGIVSNKIAGIGDQLPHAREEAARAAGSVRLSGADPNAAIRDLIDVLDTFLISGMGYAVAIDYAKPSVASLKSREQGPKPSHYVINKSTPQPPE